MVRVCRRDTEVMSNVDSPAVARRRVRLALRAARVTKKLTQSQVAKAMDWSLSKVIRIEKGEVNVSPSDLKVLLEHLDVTDPAKVEELLEDVRLSRSERWTISTEDRHRYTPAMIELLQFEADALTVRYYNGVVVPGPLQLRGYSEALFLDHPVPLETAVINARVELRQLRRQRMYEPNAPDYLVLLDESVLMRPIGGPHLMAEQLELLMRMMDERRIQLRIAPLNGKIASIFLGPFVLVDLEDDRSAMLYRESASTDETIHDPDEVEQHRVKFDVMWRRCLDREDSRQLMAERAASFREQAD